MINKIINIKNFNDNYGYYELKENKYEGSFIEILNDKNNIKISNGKRGKLTKRLFRLYLDRIHLLYGNK